MKRWLIALAAAMILSSGPSLYAADEPMKPADKDQAVIDALPVAVKEAVKAKYPTGQIVEAEKHVADNATTYEIEVKVGDDRRELKLSADGKILSDSKNLDPIHSEKKDK